MMAIIKEWIEVEDSFLTSKPADAPHPRNKPWEYLLWCTKVQKIKTRNRRRPGFRMWIKRSRYLHTICQPTKRQCTNELEKFIKRPDVQLLPPRAAGGEMIPDQHLMKYTARCDHCRHEGWFCYDCAKSAIAAAVAEEREAILSIIAGGDRPWQELAKIIRARKA